MKPGSGVGVTWHQWFLLREDQARCWGTWRGLGPRARPGQSRKAASVSRTVSGNKVATSVGDGRVGEAGEGARVVGRRRGPGARRGSARSHQGDECTRLPASRGRLARRGRRPGCGPRGEQLGHGWAGCVRSNEAWAPPENSLRRALVVPSTWPHGRAGVRTQSRGPWGRPGN